MTLIHLQDVSKGMVPACGSMRPATGVTLEQFNHQMSGEPRAVNCAACKRTEVYKAAMEKFGK